MAKIDYSQTIPNEEILANKIFNVPPGDRAYTLFLGAGASVNSKIPTADGLVEKWKQELFEISKNKKEVVNKIFKEREQQIKIASLNEYKIKLGDYEIWVDKIYPGWLDSWKRKIREPNESEYGSLFRYFYNQPRERQLFIETLIDGKEPTFGYLYLSGLISANRFNRILTTNFDDLLSDALFRYYDKKAVVAAFDSSVTSFRIESTRPKIIKLHGDFLFDNLKNISQELKSLDTVMEEKLYQVCKDSGLIVVGYSGRDESVMAPLKDMVRRAQYLNMGLHWCILEPPDHNNQIEIPDLLFDIYKNNEAKVSIYLIKGFDELMEKIFMKCACELPKVLEFPDQINICNKFESAVRAGNTSNLTETMNSHLNLFLNKVSETKINIEIHIKLAETIRTSANHAKERGNFEDCEDRITDCERHLAIVDAFIDKPDVILARTYKIKSSIYILKAWVKFHQKKNNYIADTELAIEKAISVLNEGKELCNRNMNIEKWILQVYYYNFCCAYGLKKKFLNNITEEEIEIVKEELKKIQKLDFEGKEIDELWIDGDFTELTNLLPKPN